MLLGPLLATPALTHAKIQTFFEPVSPADDGASCHSAGQVTEILSLFFFFSLTTIWVVMAFLARKLPAEFNEASFLAAPLASLLGVAAIVVSHLPLVISDAVFGPDSVVLCQCTAACMLALLLISLGASPEPAARADRRTSEATKRARRSTAGSTLTSASRPSLRLGEEQAIEVRVADEGDV